VQPESVTVGTPFEVTVRVYAPRGSVISFPRASDSTAVVRMLDPVRIVTIDSVGGNVRAAVYRMAAWDVGPQPIDLGDILVRRSVREPFQSVSLGAPRVNVVSVLPADSSQRVPRPARDLIEQPPAWWFPWLPLLILAALLVSIFRWWYMRRDRVVAVRIVPDDERSMSEFDRVENMRLIEAGENGRYVVLMVDVLRDFLSAHFAAAAFSQTSAEFLTAIDVHRDRVPVERIALLLHEVDQIKFARRAIGAAQAQHLGSEAREIVKAVSASAIRLDEEQEDAA
jgi:hypothetical protein